MGPFGCVRNFLFGTNSLSAVVFKITIIILLIHFQILKCLLKWEQHHLSEDSLNSNDPIAVISFPLATHFHFQHSLITCVPRVFSICKLLFETVSCLFGRTDYSAPGTPSACREHPWHNLELDNFSQNQSLTAILTLSLSCWHCWWMRSLSR